MQRERMRGAFVRMCAGCSTRRHQSELIRIVRTKDGQIVVDPQDGREGRSAYLCRDKKCLERIRKSKRIASLLKTTEIENAVYERLEELIDG